jgi:hypothetical protein
LEKIKNDLEEDEGYKIIGNLIRKIGSSLFWLFKQ